MPLHAAEVTRIEHFIQIMANKMIKSDTGPKQPVPRSGSKKRPERVVI